MKYITKLFATIIKIYRCKCIHLDTMIQDTYALSINKYINSLLERKKDVPSPLGRWNINYCNNQMNRKIDLSNEDHCGPCGEYAIKQIDIQKQPIVEKQLFLPLDPKK